jgi:hypothetical protein
MQARLALNCQTAESGARQRFGSDMPAWWNTRYAGKPAGSPNSEGYFPIKLTFDGWKRWLLAIGSFSRSCIDPEEAARMEALHKRMEVARRAGTYNKVSAPRPSLRTGKR